MNEAKHRISILQGDITTLDVDAIVNAANSSLMGGGGVDGAIHRAAGPELKAACRRLGGCETGDAKITPGFNLPAKFIVHTVGPVWNNGTYREEALLASVYRRSLEVAKEKNIRTIAFPSISTGAYHFPFDKASRIALQTIGAFLKQSNAIDQVFLVMFSEQDYQEMLRIFRSE